MSAIQETALAFEAQTALPFAEAVERCRQALSREGFGVLTEKVAPDSTRTGVKELMKAAPALTEADR